MEQAGATLPFGVVMSTLGRFRWTGVGGIGNFLTNHHHPHQRTNVTEPVTASQLSIAFRPLADPFSFPCEVAAAIPERSIPGTCTGCRPLQVACAFRAFEGFENQSRRQIQRARCPGRTSYCVRWTPSLQY